MSDRMVPYLALAIFVAVPLVHWSDIFARAAAQLLIFYAARRT